MPWGPGHLIEAFRPSREKQQMSSELGMSVITRKHSDFMLQGFQISHTNLLDPHSQLRGAGMVGLCVTDMSQVKKLNHRKFVGFS